MKKVRVEYKGGQSVTGVHAVDYMAVDVDGAGLYAERPTDSDSETATYDHLKTEIIEQAKEHGIDPNRLQFHYDEEVLEVKRLLGTVQEDVLIKESTPRLYRNDVKGTIDLDTLTIDDGNAWVDGPHDAPYIIAKVTLDGEYWGEAVWTTLETDLNTEADLMDACDWANPDYLVDANGYRYDREA